MQIPLLDIARFSRNVSKEWLAMAEEIVSSGRILKGPYKKKFEEEFARYLGVEHVLGVASGTDALVLSLEALGIGPGDEVITHANAFISDVEAVLALGAKPVLVDKEELGCGPDVSLLELAINARTKAILVVHLCGFPADLDSIREVAIGYGLPIVEDVSQAQGAKYGSHRLGSFGSINAMSLGPVKNLAAVGDAGCIATDDPELYEKVRLLADHGQERKYEHRIYGWNSRLDELQAAWLLLGLKTLDERNAQRRDIYERYREAFSDLPVNCMIEFPHSTCVYHQAIIETAERDQLRTYLEERHVGTGIYYPYALHEQGAWKAAGFPEMDLPRAERYARENLALPVFPELTPEEIKHIIASVRSFFGASFYRG